MNTEAKVEIIVNGKTVKQYTHQGKVYIEARSGTEYSIKIKNDAWNRKLAVITVDGVNVITGQPQDEGVGQGYIVKGYDSIDIKGFRKDSDSVGAFKFTKKGNSYCNEQGLKGNNGVIGVRIFAEKERPVVMYRSITIPRIELGCHTKGFVDTSIDDIGPTGPVGPLGPLGEAGIDNVTYTTSVSNPRTLDFMNVKCSCSSDKASPDFDLGTTWGQKINDAVTYTSFDTEPQYHTDYVIYYDTRSNLEEIGINFRKEKEVFYPKAFGAFATPPKGWRG